MTTRLVGTPFLFRFSAAIPLRRTPVFVYDAIRQVARASVHGAWCDALDVASIEYPPQTLVTEVRRETTDDS